VSVCTTRLQTGDGIPQLSAVLECSDAVHMVSIVQYCRNNVIYVILNLRYQSVNLHNDVEILLLCLMMKTILDNIPCMEKTPTP